MHRTTKQKIGHTNMAKKNPSATPRVHGYTFSFIFNLLIPFPALSDFSYKM
jgi:hypothetical protein